MMVDFNCPFCGKWIAAASEWGGRKAKCPGCHKVLTIPKSGTQSGEGAQKKNTEQ
jgi:phage FluMu protein Com